MIQTQPLPAGSPRLRDRRYHAYAYTEKNERGARSIIAEGRFATQEAAEAWLVTAHGDAPFVCIDFHSKRDGWLPHRCPAR